MSHLGKEIYSFAAFRVDTLERSITCAGEPVHTTPKVFDLAVFLLRNAGKLVTKQQLLDNVWSDVEVEESALARAVSDLRRALAQHDQTVFVETVPKYGYRFIAPVEVSNGTGAPPLAEPANTVAGPASTARLRRRVLPALAAVILSAAALFLWWRPSPEPPVRSIAVLPFQVVGQVEDANVLAVGLADAVATRLTGVGSLIVRPTSTTQRFAGSAADPRQIARRLQVDALLEGTMQVLGGRVRVTTRLFRASDGAAVWSGEIETAASQAFQLEREIAQQVAERLMARAAVQDRDSAGDVSAGVARELYYRGRGFWMRRDRAGLNQAVAEFQKAIALNPGFAPAHAGLADSYLLLGLYNHLPPAEMLPKARAEAESALKLDPQLAAAHATLGLITQNWDRDWAAAERHYRRSIAAAPNYATAHHWYAEFLSVLGRFDEAETQFREAERIDPVSSIIRTDEAQLWYFARNYERSRAVLSQVLELDPAFEPAHELMALLYAAQGQDSKAWAEASRLSECQQPDSICRLRWTAWLPGRDPAAARRALRRLAGFSAARYVPPRVLALACARQGMPGEAIEFLVKAAHAREVGVITMKVDPLLDPIRTDPRFIQLLRDLRLS